LLAVTATPGAENLLVNPGFETYDAGTDEVFGWEEWNSVWGIEWWNMKEIPCSCMGFVASWESHSGNNYFRFKPGGAHYLITQVVQVRETGLYTFQAWVRWRRDQVRLVVSKNTMHPPSSYTYQGAIVRFIETDDSADTWTKSEIKDFPGSVSPDPWTKLEIKDIPLAAGSSVLLGLRSDNGMGPVMYDGIEF
jgi:hypothetical protein